MAKIKIRCDASEVEALFAEFFEGPPKLLDRLVNLVESGEQLFTLKVDTLATPAANECVVSFYPSGSLSVLVSALRAGNADL